MAGHHRRNHEQSDDSISDQACTRCRERKIRCGRELPQCNNCERDDSVTCIYQNPTKRVNHLKSLFDSVNRLNERLDGIESHLSRLSTNIAQNTNQYSSRSTPSDQHVPVGGDPEEEDDETRPGSLSPSSDRSDDLHVFHHTSDMVDHYHGPSSLFVLCKRFESCVIAAKRADHGTPLYNVLQNLCKKAGSLEPFPPFGGKSVINLLSQQQANIVIGQFVQRLSCTTDIFVKSNLLANVERLYSGVAESGEDVWAICLQVITVLVWGTEITTQYGNGVFGDFARSFLPSRAALVSSSLLTTPKLINVQTLILLSVAAQQFDPPGWAEFIFSSACGLARTMGLHQTQLFPGDTSGYEAIERSKVLQSLYVRDKSLCTARGAVSWLPTNDCVIAHQISAANDQGPYSSALQLAMIQDQAYSLAHTAASRISKASKLRTTKIVRSVEHRLTQYERSFGVLDRQASSYSSNHAILALEFLATRILALQYGSEQRHAEQVRLDARTSCLLLLIAHGTQDREVLDAFNARPGQTSNSLDGGGHLNEIESRTVSLTSILDAFSVPAFFILLEDHLRHSENDKCSDADLRLLRRVSTCYNKGTEKMQSSSYHRRVSCIFEQLLTINDLITGPPTHDHSVSFDTTEPMSQLVLSLNTQTQDDLDVSPPHSLGDGSSLSSLSQFATNPHTPFSWDLGSSIPSSLEMYAPVSSAGLGDTLEHGMIDLFSQFRQGSPIDNSGQFISLSEISPNQNATRKRPRPLNDLDFTTEDNRHLK
ncbi:hypothetical protein PSPO01_12783 [Paraphaeosphaeria sporulosa]